MAKSVAAEILDLPTKALITQLLVDVAALRTAHNGVAAKLDADAGVTDTNYTALYAAPAATVIA